MAESTSTAIVGVTCRACLSCDLDDQGRCPCCGTENAACPECCADGVRVDSDGVDVCDCP